MKNGRTLIIIILVFIILISILAFLGYNYYFKKQPPAEEEQKEIVAGEVMARENKSDGTKTDIFIKDPKTNKEVFFITLSDIDRRQLQAEFRNGHLYITKDLFPRMKIGEEQLMRYSSHQDKGDILLKAKKISSFRISPDETSAAVSALREDPISYTFNEGKGYEFIISDDLIFIDLSTKEQEKFNLMDLAADEMISYLRDIAVYAYTQDSLWVGLLKWSLDGEEFWGDICLVGSADPPIPSKVSLFKIDVKSWETEKFTIPSEDLVNPVFSSNLNLERESILFETTSFDGGLMLFLYEFRSKEKKLIVSYSKNIFNKYFKSFLEYYYPELGGVEVRRLEPKWVDNDTVSYLDFETREERIEKIE